MMADLSAGFLHGFGLVSAPSPMTVGLVPSSQACLGRSGGGLKQIELPAAYSGQLGCLCLSLVLGLL